MSTCFVVLLRRQRLNPVAWLQITENSLADFSHLTYPKLSWEIGRDWGGLQSIPACLAILRYVLFNLDESVFQDDNLSVESLSGRSVASTILLVIWPVGQTDLSGNLLPLSCEKDNLPPKFNLLSLLHSHSSVGS